MILIRFTPEGFNKFRPGLMTGDTIYDISSRYSTIPDFLSEHSEGWNGDSVELTDLESYSRNDVHLGAPVDESSLVYAVAANYREHAEEAGLSVPSLPIIFIKPTTALVGCDGALRIPPIVSEMDYEGEMAVVIGRTASGVSSADAPRHVAGVTILNDATARDHQWVDLGKHRIVDWFSSKALDGSTPVGPGVVSVSEVGDPHRLKITTHLNGQLMQDADTSLMVYSVWELIEFITARVTLRPGDVIATGTPYGVGGFREIFLKDGDIVRVEVGGIGVLENRVVQS